jgi:hypothetical protein
MAAQGIDRLRSLPDQKFADEQVHRRPFRHVTFHGNKTHRRAQCRFVDCHEIRCTTLLALGEGRDVSERDEPHNMAQLPHLAPPRVQAAGFHRNDATRQLAKAARHLIPSQLLAQQRLPSSISPCT